MMPVAVREAAGRAALALSIAHSATALNRTKIAVRDLDFFYGDVRALKGVSLHIPERQVTAIIGPSGCGKSTLLRVFNRLYDMYPEQRVTGSVQMDGHEILGRDVDVRLLRSRVGMVFQQAQLLPMSVGANIVFGIRLHETLCRADRDALVAQSLDRADLWTEVKDRLSAPAWSLSGGQQQRLCIARALAVRPEVLLLDEPTSALDPISMARIEQLIDQLKQTLTIAMVTHNLQQAARCADQVAFFYLGEMIEAGPAAQIFTAPRLPQTRNYVAGRFG